MTQMNFGADAPRVYLGDHLKTPRIGFCHHGIYAGNGMVIARTRLGVRACFMDEFTRGCGFDIVAHDDRAFSRFECVSRAKLMIGSEEYNLAFKNCEHFVTWCITGKGQSSQVQRAATLALAALSGTAALTALLIKHPQAIKKFALYAGIPLTGTAGLGLRIASLALNTAQTVSTVKSLNHIRKTDLSSFDKTMALAAVIAGLSEEHALNIIHSLNHQSSELKIQATETYQELKDRILKRS